jgi:dipeptidyl aminopeptidase/acylaminoacyl peptidase
MKTTTPIVHHLTYDSILHQSDNAIIFTTLGPLGTIPKILTDYHGTDVQNFKLPITAPPSTNSISYTYQKIAGFDTVVMSNRNLSESKKHPLIIWLHGGPYRQSSFIRHTYISYGVYDWILEQAVNQGAYVVKIDYPGSYGSGRKNSESIKSGVGLVDVTAVKSVIDDFMTHNTVDGVYLVGNSYGGYLALRTAVEYPDQITGTLSINGVTDWQSLLIYYKNSIFNEFFNGLPSSHNKKLFAQASIFSRIKNLKHPVTIIQGEIDSTIPKFQATALKSALDYAGIQFVQHFFR